jgi:hypothetical protein
MTAFRKYRGRLGVLVVEVRELDLAACGTVFIAVNQWQATAGGILLLVDYPCGRRPLVAAILLAVAAGASGRLSRVTGGRYQAVLSIVPRSLCA